MSKKKVSGCIADALPILLQTGRLLSSVLKQGAIDPNLGEQKEIYGAIDTFQELLGDECPAETVLLRRAQDIISSLYAALQQGTLVISQTSLDEYLSTIHAFRSDLLYWAVANDVDVQDLMSSMNLPGASQYAEIRDRLLVAQSRLNRAILAQPTDVVYLASYLALLALISLIY